ncbi:TonB-linked outer membrane protein, SusC/RagA family [Pedobacter sp. ok626]|uniref:SusC/RagA family TonB-linked outer membrane protein n=1 Tax=Pedobacter sp. ok626 TaxID=1761882 RepID=UPI00087E58C5|nr:SusC/RagA family TonB-linked outer membrane protein [Pedobacter sp. ok626]SDK27184.1 TonB-linked outer membrane protein, SusC/RagA family [Pedobacter sp. ok626]
MNLNIYNQGMSQSRLPLGLFLIMTSGRRSVSNNQTRKKAVLIMKLIIIIMTVCFVQASAGTYAQNINLSRTKVSLKSVLKEIKQQSGYDIVYADYLLKNASPVTIQLHNATLKSAIGESLKGQKLTYEILDKTVVIRKKEISLRDRIGALFTAIDVRGRVLDEKNEPLVGAVVKVKGTNTATATNSKGDFELNGIDEQAVLVVSFIGYTLKEVPASQVSPITVRLEINQNELEEVSVMVSTGYQQIPKERATGSYGVVTQKNLVGKLQTNILDRLEGQVAGLTSYKGTIQVRGKSTISGTTAPLYVVDGVPYEGSIDAINPSDVLSVTVLKDATAASIYGARSANGVIVITTKMGVAGPLRISYNGSLKFTPLPDVDYNNLLSSSEFIDFQQTLYKLSPGVIQPGLYVNEVRQLFFDRTANKITEAELNRQLDVYRNRDRKSQLTDELLRKRAVDQQHNLSLSGGTAKHRYALSVNYLEGMPYERAQTNDRIGYNFKNSLDIAPWLRLDAAILGSFTGADYSNGFSGMSVYTGAGKASYLLFKDENGNELPWYQAKSQGELDRLTGLGLLNESYFPLRELDRHRFEAKDKYQNFNVGLNFKLIKGLTLDLKYQKELRNNYQKQFYSKDSWAVRTMINDATQIKSGVITQNIPTGGQIKEVRGDGDSHTLRAQLNYNKTINDKHGIAVIAGAEQRKVRSSSTSLYRVGYDDNSLSFKPIDEKSLANLTGTQALGGVYRFNSMGAGFFSTENRYVSFYGNASYTYNRRFTASASIRMDQSNLFGTDPKYQYRPLWSAGGSYLISEHDLDWLDRLSVRATYGINGNIAKQSGPYLTVIDGGINDYINEPSSRVQFPPNSGLRWEKTRVTNLGVDFNLFKSALSGSIEVYNKSTTDLLKSKNADPTLGWTELTVNYGDMYNRGVEVSLNSQNIVRTDFSWRTSMNFSYNKNKLTRIENALGAAINYINGDQIREGKPLNSLYTVRWAGLDNTGAPQGYDRNGNIVKSFGNLTMEDLQYAGTTVPPYAASLSNNFKYKNFDLSFMFIYYGGHVMRSMFGNYIVGTGISANVDRMTANFWQKPGDENDPSKAPAYRAGVNANLGNLWSAADKHVQKGDYIKLRDISIGYELPTKTVHKYGLDNVRISCQIQNAWRWAANNQGLDPEVWNGSSLTPSRGNLEPPTYTLGLSLNF